MQSDRDIPANPVLDILAALTLLSRVPAPVKPDYAAARGARAAWAYPVAGLVIASLAAAVAEAVLWLGVPAGVAAALALATGAFVTGALHEDGLADTADGFWGGWGRARRLEIMKDSRVGTYGVLALGLTALARWSALTALFSAGWIWVPLLAAGVMSRVPMVVLMHALPFAREDGLARLTGRPPIRAMSIAVGLGLGVALALPAGGITALASLAAMTLAMGALARTKIGGQTGDVLGAAQQLADVIILSVLAATLLTGLS